MNLRRALLLIAGFLAAGGVLACGNDDKGDDSSGEEGGVGGDSSDGGAGESGGPGGAGGESGRSGVDEELQDYLDALPPWPDPEPEHEETTDLGDETRYLDADGFSDVEFVCRRVRHDIAKNHDEILNLGGSETLLKPGILLQGAPFQEGILAAVPLRRSPITLSIDLPAEVTSVVVENPSSATLQQAVADLQVQAGQVEGDLPALVSFTRSEVESMEQLAFAVGAHGSYDSLVSSASFEAAFESRDMELTITVAAKLLQPMYTISFADDEIARAADFFVADVTAEELLEQEELGNIGRENLPVFISSVTYGRMVVFTATSSVAESASEISAALEASIGAFQGGASLDADTRSFLSSLEVEVLALGGNSSSVTGAIVSGDYSQLFSNPDASSAVPLTYVVKSIAGIRPTARLGDVRQFVTEECTPVTASGWVQVPGPEGEEIDFSDVTANADGDAFAVAADGSVYAFDGSRFLPIAADTSFTDVAVDDDGWAFAVDTNNVVWKRNPDTGGWQVGRGDIRAIDAVGSGLVVGIGMNSHLYREERDRWDGWTLVRDDGEYDTISLASSDWAYCLAGDDAARRVSIAPEASDYGSWDVLRDPQGNENRDILEHLSAASEAAVWALNTAFDIVRWDASSGSWSSDHGVPAPPSDPEVIEAVSGDLLWIIAAGQGEIYRYIPSR